ncbi:MULTISPECIES: putative DNA modification/repair radical SAM protein [Methanobacterium]|uniref:DNA modification/repair radical SAM protein n=1 Tax=Methanobacterium veterum TaxID=408577 RepID=A0A9E5DLT6_9EURY|nr:MULTISPECIES: putative DNA modification/repair radical SAM protein [Methanobacterium]MCZ3365712.1 putative DNA modification/repair radical SAM protein [Methanobacterium veterum]MCZ3371176.1 putative DNA modification/repair radical SAM protein [Methanobacterium veterum]
MNSLQKLKVLGESAKYDLCNYADPNFETYASGKMLGVYNSTAPDGRCIPLFKVLMTNKCSNDCKYCVNRSGRKCERFEYTPQELSNLFLNYFNRRYVEGLFLSSGISGDINTSMEREVEVARILRDYGYDGYIHLKILPGTSYDLIKSAMHLADRVSINMEAATPDGFEELTSTKNYNIDILRRMKWISKLAKMDPAMAPSGQTTQFIIGATDENDEEILSMTKKLYDKLELKRSYFSAFSPLEDTPLENHEIPHPKRTSRLYQADFLLNSYGFNLDELVFDENGNIDTQIDPKYSFALNNMDLFPTEINEASYDELIRVPGIGKISAKRIITLRKRGRRFEKLEELQDLGVAVKRAEPFIKLNKSYQATLGF